MCYCPTPTLHLNLALTGDCAFLLSPKKPHSVWFISVLNYGDIGSVLIKHLQIVIPLSYPCHYTNLCPHKPHKPAHTHTHTHTHTVCNLYIYVVLYIQQLTSWYIDVHIYISTYMHYIYSHMCNICTQLWGKYILWKSLWICVQLNVNPCIMKDKWINWVEKYKH